MSYARRSRHDQGAAAVEFALVVPILLMVMLGILDYGMWFSDSLNVRQGVREGARQGVVDDLTPASGCGSTSDLARLACNTRGDIGAFGGVSYVRVALYKPDRSSTSEWKKGQQLLVCGMVKEAGLTGVTPLPSDGMLRSSVRMRVETGTHSWAAYADSLPSGQSWAWCTP